MEAEVTSQAEEDEDNNNQESNDDVEEDNNNQDEFEIDAKLSGAKINPALVMNEDAVAQSAVLFFIAGAEK